MATSNRSWNDMVKACAEAEGAIIGTIQNEAKDIRFSVHNIRLPKTSSHIVDDANNHWECANVGGLECQSHTG